MKGMIEMINNIEIILPKRIPILREKPNQDIKNKPEEFSLYFKNFIHPIYPWYDIVVDCMYGRNLGNCWRINEYPDVDEFDLTVKIYDEYGNIAAKKSTVIELYDNDSREPYNIICVGDSMTHRTVYVTHMQGKLNNLFTRGTRSFDGHVFCEGRGGWTYGEYYGKYSVQADKNDALNSVSPFLFPEGIAGKDYFGDIDYFETLAKKDRSTYCFDGFAVQTIKYGQYYHKNKKLYRQGSAEPVSSNIKWELSFAKYLERNNIKDINAVSLLMGANDLQAVPYEKTEEAVKLFIDNTKKFIASVKEADENIDVIVNMPVCGAEQHAWGMARGCSGSEKMYAHNMRAISRALIQEFEGVKGVYICPMMCCIDGEYGFAKTSVNANLYNDTQLEKQQNWVHPNEVGYKQMGDALAGTVEKLRHKRR